jgi:hypothetical protein
MKGGSPSYLLFSLELTGFLITSKTFFFDGAKKLLNPYGKSCKIFPLGFLDTFDSSSSVNFFYYNYYFCLYFLKVSSQYLSPYYYISVSRHSKALIVSYFALKLSAYKSKDVSGSRCAFFAVLLTTLSHLSYCYSNFLIHL